MDSALSAVRSIGSKSVCSELDDVQLGSIAAMEMFGRTFSGILVALQRRMDKETEIESRFKDIDQKIKGLDTKLSDSQSSMDRAVNEMDHKLQRQSNATTKAIESMGDRVDATTSSIRTECQSMMDAVSKRLNASSQSVNNVQGELDRLSVSLQSVSGKVDNALTAITQKQETMESQLEDTQQTLNDQLSAIQHTVLEDKAILTKRISAVSDQFEALRFEVDRVASTKADVDDLKRKANAAEFKSLKNSVNADRSKIDAINTAVGADRSKFEGEIADQRLDE